jgi:hypothetical protein
VFFFVSDKVASGNWGIVVQKEAHIRWVVVEVVHLMIRTNIGGVFVDMHVANAIRCVIGFEEREEVLAIEVEWVEANIVGAKVLENDVEVFGKLD